jgi:glyoxylase I family protein
MAEIDTHHVGVVVTDLEEAVSFYRDTLGFEVVEEFRLEEKGIGTAIGVDGVAGDFVHMDAGSTRLELIEYEPTGEDGRAGAINDRGAKHLGFAVEDIEAFYNDLPAEADPVSEPQQIDIGIDILFFRDPDGNFVEVLED